MRLERSPLSRSQLELSCHGFVVCLPNLFSTPKRPVWTSTAREQPRLGFDRLYSLYPHTQQPCVISPNAMQQPWRFIYELPPLVLFSLTSRSFSVLPATFPFEQTSSVAWESSRSCFFLTFIEHSLYARRPRSLRLI